MEATYEYMFTKRSRYRADMEPKSTVLCYSLFSSYNVRLLLIKPGEVLFHADFIHFSYTQNIHR